jgi:regulator of sirC expression with transglutaminase-like and TPR domain
MMDRLSRWRTLVALPEREIALDQAALLIAAEADPSVDESAQLSRLDEVAAQIGVADTERVCRLLFETLGIQGDDQTYDDPRNSYLNQVLNRRRGIPISLSVLLIEIGRRCGVRLEGVGMPGHFLVRDPSAPNLLIDPFAGGRRLDHRDCARLLRASVGPDLELQASMLTAVGPRSILSRMLANLEHSFRRRDDRDGMRWVTSLRVVIPGLPLAERVALSDTLALLGCYDEAAALLKEAANGPGVSAEAARALRVRARAVLAPLN